MSIWIDFLLFVNKVADKLETLTFWNINFKNYLRIVGGVFKTKYSLNPNNCYFFYIIITLLIRLFINFLLMVQIKRSKF